MLRSTVPGESRQAGCIPVGLRIDLVRLATLLFLVQVQDPHVGSSAACEEQELVKAWDMILALLPGCERLQAGNSPAWAPQ